MRSVETVLRRQLVCVQSARREIRSLRRPPWATCTSVLMVEGGEEKGGEEGGREKEGREVRGGSEGEREGGEGREGGKMGQSVYGVISNRK